MKKKIAAAIVVILVLGCLASVIATKADKGINLLVIAVRDNGKIESLKCDVKPIIKQEKTLMSIETIANVLGLELNENKQAKTITISNDKTSIQFSTVGPKILVNGGEERLLVEPEIKQGSLLVPIRFVCNKFGYNIAWEDNNEEHISYIWLSEFELLSRKDLTQGRRLNYSTNGDILELKKTGKTQRGIRLGNSYDMVTEAYGEPHNVSDDGNVIKYYGRMLPGDNDIYMEFTFEKDKLVKAEIHK